MIDIAQHHQLIKALQFIKLGKLKTVYLTPREVLCLVYWLHHYTAKEIASKLESSHRTVQTHLYRITKKIGYKKRSDINHLLKKSKKNILIKQLFLCIKENVLD